MPPLIIAGLIGAGVYLGIRVAAGVLAELAERSHADLQPGSRSSAFDDREAKDLGTLEPDPESGVYRPVRRG